jgi:hypothetical protein
VERGNFSVETQSEGEFAFLRNFEGTDDVIAKLDLAVAASRCDQVHIVHKPRLPNDIGSSYVFGELGD